MLSFLPGPLIGSLSFLLIVVNTVFWCIPLYTVAILKFLLPLPAWNRRCNKMLNALASNWISCNNLNLALFNDLRLEVAGLEGLDPHSWYLVLSNHQTWTDILILQKVFNRKIPFLKFFIKQELLYVPILGIAWWALDYPVMKRYTKEFLEKNPHLKGKDLETTRKACEKFKTIPVSVMNFVEGTRFTPAKHNAQQSPYAHLLRPKAAGIAFVLDAMQGQLKQIVDVTIAYPGGSRDIWQFLCGRVKEVKVRVRTMPLAAAPSGDYFNDPAFQKTFQDWLNGLWAEKDVTLNALLASDGKK